MENKIFHISLLRAYDGGNDMHITRICDEVFRTSDNQKNVTIFS